MAHRTRFRRLFAGTGIALLALTAGCSVTVTRGTEPPAASPPSATSSVNPTGPAGTSTPNGTSSPAGAVGLDTVVQSASRPADTTSARVLGDASGATYPNAISLWAGCDGVVDSVTYLVTGHSTLQGRLALRDSTPRDIVIEVLIMVDGDSVQNVRLDASDPTPAFVPVQLVVKGKSLVTTLTKVVKGTCADASESYAVLVDGYVS